MTRVYPLFSSSSANAHFIGSPSGGILIDAGASCKRLVNALHLNGLDENSVRAIFITHEHSDHIAGLKVFTNRRPVPIIASGATLEFLTRGGHISPLCKTIEMSNREVVGCGFTVTGFKTPHDAYGSLGYKIKTPEGKQMCLCTDLGYITEEVHSALVGSELVLLESNYDEYMLKTGKYPAQLKQRIASRKGHLSNTDSAKEVRSLLESGTSHIILGHLSRENNTPQIAKNALLRELGDDYVLGEDYTLCIAPVETNGLEVEF